MENEIIEVERILGFHAHAKLQRNTCIQTQVIEQKAVLLVHDFCVHHRELPIK